MSGTPQKLTSQTHRDHPHKGRQPKEAQQVTGKEQLGSPRSHCERNTKSPNPLEQQLCAPGPPFNLSHPPKNVEKADVPWRSLLSTHGEGALCGRPRRPQRGRHDKACSFLGSPSTIWQAGLTHSSCWKSREGSAAVKAMEQAPPKKNVGSKTLVRGAGVLKGSAAGQACSCAVWPWSAPHSGSAGGGKASAGQTPVSALH